MWTHSSIHDYISIVPSASAKLVNLMKGRHRLCRQDKSIMKKAILVYVFHSTRSDVPTIGGGDHVDLSRVNFAYSGMSMGALAHSLCSLSRSLRRVRQGGIRSLLTWRIGALPTPPTICSHCQPLLG